MLLSATGWRVSPIQDATEILTLKAQDSREAQALARVRQVLKDARYTAEDLEALLRHGRAAVTPATGIGSPNGRAKIRAKG